MVPLTDNMRGAVYMMLSMAAFVCNDTLVKLVSADLPLFPTVFLRGLVATALLLAIARSQDALWPPLDTGDRRLIVLRMAGEIGATLCFLTALFNMPIANATAILQSMPLAVTLGASIFLREPVGWRRYSAIAVGFIGVMVIVQPGAEGFNVYSLWALGAVAFIVLRDLTTRRMRREIPSIFVALTTGVGITAVAGFGSLTQDWSGMNLHVMGLLVVAAVFLVVGYLTAVLAMRHGEIGFVSPFRYTILIWAILLGALVFGERPSAAMLLGSAIVVVTGGYTFYRERRVRRRAPAMRPFSN